MINGKAPLVIKKLLNPSEKILDGYLRQGWKILSQRFYLNVHKVTLVK